MSADRTAAWGDELQANSKQPQTLEDSASAAQMFGRRWLDQIDRRYQATMPVMGASDDSAEGHGYARAVAELSVLREILGDAHRFATHDPGVDWPSEKHDDPVDAIMAALDRVREEAAA